MTIELLNQISRQTFEATMLVGGPILLVCLVVGLFISLLQSITQLQEMTLTFVPKIIAVFLAIFVGLPWMLNVLIVFAKSLFENIPMYVR
jgi:flagellar biosynthetic protein FliQ